MESTNEDKTGDMDLLPYIGKLVAKSPKIEQMICAKGIVARGQKLRIS